MTRTNRVQQARKVQARFSYVLPKISGYDVREEQIGNCRCMVISKPEHQHTKAVVYYACGGYIRYQVPTVKSIRRYIKETGRDLWVPFYPLFPDATMLDAVEAAYTVHRKMLEVYEPETIAWLGFPCTVLVYGGDEIMSGEAPEYEKAFLRCDVRDYEIYIESHTFHGYPVFTFTPEGRRGEKQIIEYLK